MAKHLIAKWVGALLGVLSFVFFFPPQLFLQVAVLTITPLLLGLLLRPETNTPSRPWVWAWLFTDFYCFLVAPVGGFVALLLIGEFFSWRLFLALGIFFYAGIYSLLRERFAAKKKHFFLLPYTALLWPAWVFLVDSKQELIVSLSLAFFAVLLLLLPKRA